MCLSVGLITPGEDKKKKKTETITASVFLVIDVIIKNIINIINLKNLSNY